jgi:hypothetical protein
MREIPLSTSRACPNRGRYVALVDDEDYAWASVFRWAAHGLYGNEAVYARRIDITDGRKTVFLHREIWLRWHGEIPRGMEIDHADISLYRGLDNRRSNLRIASRSSNMANTGLRSTNSSGFKGVSWDRARNKWHAKIKVDYRQKPWPLRRLHHP